jgi:hypothetical protein
MEDFCFMHEHATWRGNWTDVGYNKRRQGHYHRYQTDRSVSILTFALTLVRSQTKQMQHMRLMYTAVHICRLSSFSPFYVATHLLQGSLQISLVMNVKVDNSD